MKNILAVIILFLMVISGFAQTLPDTLTKRVYSKITDSTSTPIPQPLSPKSISTNKGNWLVGGQAAHTNYNTKARIFTLTLTPRAGYFIKNKLAIGAALNLDMQSAYETLYTGWGIAPFIRKYFGGGERTTFFIQDDMGIGAIRSILHLQLIII